MSNISDPSSEEKSLVVSGPFALRMRKWMGYTQCFTEEEQAV